MAPSPPPPKTLDKVWWQAVDQAAALLLPDALWQRPQVQGMTIDGPTSRDLDDAIHLEETPTGAIASIHIADVAELVTVGSALDKVALARTQTRYFSRGNAPMLPHTLSEDKLSLLEGQRRPTVTIQITLNHQAEIQTTDIFESWLSSAKRFSYEQADRACQNPESPFCESLQLCQAWAERLNQERKGKGAIGGFFNPSGFWVDENGAVMISEGKLFHAQMIIQEFMILANRAVAHWFAQRDVLALYRNHTARTIAPEREQIMQALLTTGSMELIRRKLQNWLNKAEYNPTLIGHFALNLTAYCHFTSPIRRLADLLNHRILKALIHEQPHPYRKFELEQLCTYIATVTQADENETKDFHKQRSKRAYQSQLQETAVLAALSDKEFGNVVKHAAREDNFEPIQAAARMRLEQGHLSVQSLYLLLIRSGDVSLQQQILALLKRQPQNATSVLGMAIDQEPTWEQLNYVEGQNTAPFLCWAEVSIEGQVTKTIQPAQSSRKQNARHLASMNWLEAFVSGELVRHEQRQVPEPPAINPPNPNTMESSQESAPTSPPTSLDPLEDEQNFVGLLQELCQTRGCALPAYQFTGESPEFCCTCTVIVQGQSFGGKGVASQKKKAKHFAAKETLLALQKWFQYGERVALDVPEMSAPLYIEEPDTQVTEASAPISHPILLKPLKDGQNFVGLLQELCQTLAWALPAYEFWEETPEFACRCTVLIQGQSFCEQANASKKKRAKYFAAKAVLLALQQHFQGD